MATSSPGCGRKPPTGPRLSAPDWTTSGKTAPTVGHHRTGSGSGFTSAATRTDGSPSVGTAGRPELDKAKPYLGKIRGSGERYPHWLSGHASTVEPSPTVPAAPPASG